MHIRSYSTEDLEKILTMDGRPPSSKRRRDKLNIARRSIAMLPMKGDLLWDLLLWKTWVMLFPTTWFRLMF